MNKIDAQYQALLQDILDNGVQKKDRTCTGTISVFGRQIRHRMSDGFPIKEAIIKKTNNKIKVRQIGRLGYEDIKSPFIPNGKKNVYMKSELIFI